MQVMKAWTWMTVLSWLCLSSVQAAAQELTQEREERKADSKAPAAQLPLSMRLTDEVISKAVKESLAESPRVTKQQSGRVLSGDKYEKFSRDFSEAEKPGCLNPDAMKFQPHSLSFKLLGQEYEMAATGKLAIPFWIAAIARGKCN
jgi:hypothetical protein